MKLDYRRILRMIDVELFMVREERYSYDELAYILIVDAKRKSKLQDFPVLIGVETEEEFESSENHITVLLLSKNKLSVEMIEDISYFVQCMLDTKPNCSYYMSEIVKDYNIEYNLSNLTPIVDFIKPYVKECNGNINLSEVKESDFKYFTQGIRN